MKNKKEVPKFKTVTQSKPNIIFNKESLEILNEYTDYILSPKEIDKKEISLSTKELTIKNILSELKSPTNIKLSNSNFDPVVEQL